MANVVTSDIPCLMFAIRRENLFYRRTCRPLRRIHAAPCAAFLAGPPAQPHLVVETGIGRAAVHAALDWALRGPMRLRFVLYAGFAGALDPALAVGDILLADEIVDDAGGRWATAWPGATRDLRRGRLLTVDRLVATPDEKRTLAALHLAQAVDMEAAHAAGRCADQGVPFHCIRAISDAAEAPLSPALLALLSGGNVSPRRALSALVHRPALAAEFWRLARDTRVAAQRLAAALVMLLGNKVEQAVCWA